MNLQDNALVYVENNGEYKNIVLLINGTKFYCRLSFKEDYRLFNVLVQCGAIQTMDKSK